MSSRSLNRTTARFSSSPRHRRSLAPWWPSTASCFRTPPTGASRQPPSPRVSRWPRPIRNSGRQLRVCQTLNSGSIPLAASSKRCWSRALSGVRDRFLGRTRVDRLGRDKPLPYASPVTLGTVVAVGERPFVDAIPAPGQSSTGSGRRAGLSGPTVGGGPLGVSFHRQSDWAEARRLRDGVGYEVADRRGRQAGLPPGGAPQLGE